MREEEGKIREKGVGDEEREMRDKGGHSFQKNKI